MWREQTPASLLDSHFVSPVYSEVARTGDNLGKPKPWVASLTHFVSVE